MVRHPEKYKGYYNLDEMFKVETARGFNKNLKKIFRQVNDLNRLYYVINRL